MGVNLKLIVACIVCTVVFSGLIYSVSAQQKTSGESDLWGFIRRHMAGPLYWLHLKLESVKSVPEIKRQLAYMYQTMFNIKGKTEMTFIQNSDYVMAAMLLSFLSLIMLILLNFASHLFSILFAILIIITYRLQGTVWCFDNLMLLISLITLAPSYFMKNPTAFMPYVSTFLGIYFTYRMISRLRGRSNSSPQPRSYENSTNVPNGYDNSNASERNFASIEHRLAMLESQQQTILAKLDALTNKVDNVR